jgi:hypothetical protein
MMDKRFLIAVDGLDRAGRNTVTHLLQDKRWPLWHWFEDLWLVAGVPGEVTPMAIAQEISKLLNRPNLLVLELSKINLTGFVPDLAADWLAKNLSTSNLLVDSPDDPPAL